MADWIDPRDRHRWPGYSSDLNREGYTIAEQLAYSYEIYIGAPAAKVWAGIVDGEMTRHYVYGTRLDSTLKKGAPYSYLDQGDFKVVDGEILEIEPEKRLVMSWQAHWDEAVAQDRPSRVTYELSAAGPSATKLQSVHDNFDGPTATYTGSVAGWPLMMSSPKTLLETGRPLPTSGSLLNEWVA